MRTKGCWAIAGVLACGVFASLMCSEVKPPEDLEKFKAKILEKRQQFAEKINTEAEPLAGIVADGAVIIDVRGEGGVRKGRGRVEEKWRGIRGQKKIEFDTARARIEFVSAKFRVPLALDKWASYDYIAIEFGSYNLVTGPQAKGSSAAASQSQDPKYCAIWGHQDDCNWGIIAEIDY